MHARIWQIILFSSLSSIVHSQSNENIKICKPVKYSINLKPMTNQKNVLGTDLSMASINPMTGFFRNGFCTTDKNDSGSHVIAAIVTDEFLKYSLSRGNDLISAYPESDFPGLRAGDIWCLCALRWKEAYLAGVAPQVILEATNIRALDYVTIDMLQKMKAK